jgi:hypothetical protein
MVPVRCFAAFHGGLDSSCLNSGNACTWQEKKYPVTLLVWNVSIFPRLLFSINHDCIRNKHIKIIAS